MKKLFYSTVVTGVMAMTFSIYLILSYAIRIDDLEKQLQSSRDSLQTMGNESLSSFTPAITVFEDTSIQWYTGGGDLRASGGSFALIENDIELIPGDGVPVNYKSRIEFIDSAVDTPSTIITNAKELDKYLIESDSKNSPTIDEMEGYELDTFSIGRMISNFQELDEYLIKGEGHFMLSGTTNNTYIDGTVLHSDRSDNKKTEWFDIKEIVGGNAIPDGQGISISDNKQDTTITIGTCVYLNRNDRISIAKKAKHITVAEWVYNENGSFSLNTTADIYITKYGVTVPKKAVILFKETSITSNLYE